MITGRAATRAGEFTVSPSQPFAMTTTGDWTFVPARSSACSGDLSQRLEDGGKLRAAVPEGA